MRKSKAARSSSTVYCLLFTVYFALALVATIARAQASHPASGASTSFRYVDIFVDSNANPLAAYQIEFTAGDAELVGIEGSSTPAFKTPPYYDPRALQHNRVILAAFRTGTDLPAGKTRVARLMLHLPAGERGDYHVTLQVAAGPTGQPIPATVSLLEGVAP